jgi:hypothetical protein
MTGYLRRLALSAVTPAAVHPLGGSFFSPSEAAPAPEATATEEQILTTVPAAPSTVGAPQLSRAAGYAANVVPVRLLPERPLAGDHPDRAAVEAEPAPPQPQSPFPSEHDVRAPAAQAVTQSRRDAADARDRNVRSAPPERPFVPLLDLQIGEPAALPELAEPPRSASAPTARRAATDGARRRPHPPSAERDEIEIHIGRIEVTAVQTAAPQVPTPRRHAPSLDDYLRRRNGGR